MRGHGTGDGDTCRDGAAVSIQLLDSTTNMTAALTRRKAAEVGSWKRTFPKYEVDIRGWLVGIVSIVKLRRGSGKDRQGMALKAKGLKA